MEDVSVIKKATEMNAEHLLAHFDRIADAPDAIPRLRRFILDLAVRGKLVPQDPNDEPASELLKQIEAEKERLVKIRQIKTPKVLPRIHASDVPFHLPRLWAWVRIDNLSPWSLTDGDWIETKDQSENGSVRLIQLADIGDGSFLDRSARFITEETEKRLNCTRLEVGDVLIARLPNPIGRACIFPEIGQSAITAVDIAILRLSDGLNRNFVALALNAPTTRRQVEAYGKGTTRFRVSTGHLKTVLIPLPPLAEQHRIVAKVDELMTLCDRLEAARMEREATRDQMATASLAHLNAPDPATFQNHATFALNNLTPLTTRPDQIKALRQTILNLAVRGKLVPQDPNDEPASELLKRIAKDFSRQVAEGKLNKPKPVKPLSAKESLFSLPRGWAVARFNQVAAIQSNLVNPKRYATLPHIAPDNIESWTARLLSYVSVGEAGVYSGKHLFSAGAILYSKIRPNLAKVAKVNFDGLCSADMYPIHALIDRDFLVKFMITKDFVAQAVKEDNRVAMPKINQSALSDIVVLVPPLAEQHRIVAKVDEFMALCDRLEASLATGDETQGRLVEAVLCEALHR